MLGYLVFVVLLTLGIAANYRFREGDVPRSWRVVAGGFAAIGVALLVLHFRLGGVARNSSLLPASVVSFVIAAVALQRLFAFDASAGLPARIQGRVVDVFEKNMVLFGMNGLTFWAQSATTAGRTVEVQLVGSGVDCAPARVYLRPGQLVSVGLTAWAPRAAGAKTMAGLVVAVEGAGGRRILYEHGRPFSDAFEVGAGMAAVIAGATLLASGGQAIGTVHGKEGYWVTFISPAQRPRAERPSVVWEPTPAALRRAQGGMG